MIRFVLVAVETAADAPEGAELVDIVIRDETVTSARLVVQGRAVDVLLQAAGLCTAAELHRARLHQLPAEHRRVGQREYEAFLAAGAAGMN